MVWRRTNRRFADAAFALDTQPGAGGAAGAWRAARSDAACSGAGLACRCCAQCCERAAADCDRPCKWRSAGTVHSDSRLARASFDYSCRRTCRRRSPARIHDAHLHCHPNFEHRSACQRYSGCANQRCSGDQNGLPGPPPRHLRYCWRFVLLGYLALALIFRRPTLAFVLAIVLVSSAALGLALGPHLDGCTAAVACRRGAAGAAGLCCWPAVSRFAARFAAAYTRGGALTIGLGAALLAWLAYLLVFHAGGISGGITWKQLTVGLPDTLLLAALGISLLLLLVLRGARCAWACDSGNRRHAGFTTRRARRSWCVRRGLAGLRGLDACRAAGRGPR